MEPSLIIAAAARAYPGETVNGDGWAVERWDGGCRIAVLDGLGHGPDAAAATALGLAALAADPQLAPAAALRACHWAMRGSRGAAGLVATIDATTGVLTYAGCGNIEGRLVTSAGSRGLTSYRGILGVADRTIREETLHLSDPWLLALFSDGVVRGLELPLARRFTQRELDALAAESLTQWARSTDDATMVLVAGP